jgi:hypothetical protein
MSSYICADPRFERAERWDWLNRVTDRLELLTNRDAWRILLVVDDAIEAFSESSSRDDRAIRSLLLVVRRRARCAMSVADATARGGYDQPLTLLPREAKRLRG